MPRGSSRRPSGKCEFFSDRLAAQGLDGLPDHVPNHEVPTADAAYPLAMISPPARNFLNPSFVNVKSLRDSEGEPLLEITADDAATRGIADGDMVRVFNARGSYRCTAPVSARGPVLAWSTGWASGGANWDSTAPTSISSPAKN